MNSLQYPLDTGPIYRETLMGRLPVEPWNTMSNLVFLAIVIHWAVRVYPHWRRHLFLAMALPVLFIGFIGGSLYHGLRDHEAWLWMDWLPIVLLCLAATLLFARRSGLTWPRTTVLGATPFLMRWLMTDHMGWSATVLLNVEYVLIGVAVLAPLIHHLRGNDWRGGPLIAAAAGLFGMALLFRVLDHHPFTGWLTMGTHWLWHLFGGMAVHFLIRYIHQDDLAPPADRVRARKRPPGPATMP